jgi:hypothetical protein
MLSLHTSKRQVINLRNFCVWLVCLKRMIMHGLENFKFAFLLLGNVWKFSLLLNVKPLTECSSCLAGN